MNKKCAEFLETRTMIRGLRECMIIGHVNPSTKKGAGIGALVFFNVNLFTDVRRVSSDQKDLRIRQAPDRISEVSGF